MRDLDIEAITIGAEIQTDLFRGQIEYDLYVTLLLTEQSQENVAKRIEQLYVSESPMLPDVIAVVPSNEGTGEIIICEEIPNAWQSFENLIPQMNEWDVGQVILELLFLEMSLREEGEGLHANSFDPAMIFRINGQFKIFSFIDAPAENNIRPLAELLDKVLEQNENWEVARECKDMLYEDPDLEVAVAHIWFDRCRIFRRLDLMLRVKQVFGDCCPHSLTNLKAVKIALIKYRFRKLDKGIYINSLSEKFSDFFSDFWDRLGDAWEKLKMKGKGPAQRDRSHNRSSSSLSSSRAQIADRGMEHQGMGGRKLNKLNNI